MKIEELSENPTIEEIKKLDKPSLDILPYEVYRWECCCKNCPNGTTVRDYGFAPHYFLNRNSKKASESPRTYWYKLDLNVWLCGKHLEYHKRLGADIMWEKYIDIEKPRLGLLVKKINQNIEQIG